MDLTTRCPECGTTFSASLAQLQLRKGYIRCINCAHIFDGFDAVVSSDAAAARSLQEPSAQQDMSAPQETHVHREPSIPIPRVLRQRPDRKSVGEGTRVSVRVDAGGVHLIKKKTKNTQRK